MADLPFTPWEEFRSYFWPRWSQGQHIVITGPTGVGKSLLAQHILPRRSYVVVFGTKIEDETLDAYRSEFGYRRLERWPPPQSLDPHQARELLWPQINSFADIDEKLVPTFSQALADIFARGNWTVLIDEGHFMANRLHLALPLADLLHQGRSHGVTVILLAQRPAHLPVVVYSSASWAFIGRCNDYSDAKRLSELGGIDRKQIMDQIRNLGPHEFLAVECRGEPKIWRTQLELPKSTKG